MTNKMTIGITLLIIGLCSIIVGTFLNSCSSDHLLGLKFLPQKFYYELPDGKIISSWYVTKDLPEKINKSKLYTSKLNTSEINSLCNYNDSTGIQEITTNDLKIKFIEYENIFVSIYYGCPIAYKFELWQFNKLVDTLSKAMVNPRKMAFVLISASHDFERVKFFIDACHYKYTSYVIPYEGYGIEIQSKEINFIKELCPPCYKELKYYSIDNTLLLLNNKGETIKVIDYQFDESGRKEIKDFKNVSDELLMFVK